MRPAKKQRVDKADGKKAGPLPWEATDAHLWDPNALVGHQIRVLWPSENRYFPGTVAKFLPARYEHVITYDDGDEETLVLAVERVQLLPASLASLPPPSPANLTALARIIDAMADTLEEQVLKQRTGRGRAMIKDEDRQKLETLRRRAADARVARERREEMLAEERQAAEQARRQKQLASPPPCTPSRRRAAQALGSPGGGRTPRAAAVSAAAAISASAQKRPASTAAAAAASAQRSGQLVLADPDGAEQGVGRVRGGTEKGARVCSPASAKRRQLQQVMAGKKAKGRKTGEGGVGGGGGGFEAADVEGASKAALAAWAGWAKAGKGGAPADGDIGKLYVPRAWLTLRSSSGEAATRAATAVVEPGAEAPAAAPADAGPKPEGKGEAAGAGPGADASAAPTAGQAGPAAGAASSSSEERRLAAAAAAELLDAYKHFRRHCGAFKQYHELQVLLWLSPQALVGRELRVLWPDEEAWFCGRVTRYDEASGRHTVEYDDGDMEHLHLAAEEVRLQLLPGEADAGLAPQPPAALAAAAEALAADVAQLRKRVQALEGRKEESGGAQGGKGKSGAGGAGQAPKQAAAKALKEEEGTEVDAQATEDEDPTELTAKADRWAARAAQLRALAALMAREEETNPAAATTSQPAQVLGEAEAAGANAAAGKPPAQAGPAADAAAEAAPSTPPREGEPQAPSASEVILPQASLPDVLQPDGSSGPADAAMGSEPSASAPGLDARQPEPPLPAGWDSSQVLRPGEVVFGQVRRSSPWPALVITREEAEREGLSLGRLGATATGSSQLVFLRFFGDYTVYALPAVAAGQRIPERGGCMPFLTGLDMGWHVRRVSGGQLASAAAAGGAGSVHGQRFMRALFELRTYMLEGELPRGMIPPNYDEDEDEEEGGEEAAGVGARRAGGKAGGRDASALASAAGKVSFPLVISQKLKIMALGEVVWLSRWFHDEKSIYPLGYTAQRLMASGASGGREVLHTLTVEADADGVRPVFRIKPEGGAAVAADTASRAMRALFEADERTSGRAFCKTGADLYGLSNARVAALIRALPAAERCERFANWPDQDKPPVPELTAFEEVQRRALYARALRLPPGVASVPQSKAGMCFECEVCGEDEESPDNLKLQCDMCHCVVHSACYGAPQPPHGALWLCDVCQLHAAGLPADRAPPCELCPVAGGPMKRSEGGYVHLLCAVWTPGVAFGDPDTLDPVEGVAKAVQSRSSLRCFLCRQPHGAPLQCAGDPKCYTAFHPMCAREAGLALCELRLSGSGGAASRRRSGRGTPGRNGAAGSGAGPMCAASPAGKAKARPFAAKAPEGPVGGEAEPMEVDPAGEEEGKENRAVDPGPGAPTNLATALAGAAGPAQPAQPEPPVKAGSIAPDAAALAAASAGAPARKGRGRVTRPGQALSAADRLAATLRSSLQKGACKGGVALGNGMALVCFCPRHEDAILQAPQFITSYPGGRFADRRAELTRQQLRARRQQQQLLLSEAEGVAGDGGGGVGAGGERGGDAQAAKPKEAATGRAISFENWRSRGHRAPEAVAIATKKRTFVRQLPYLVTGRLQRSEEEVRAVVGSCGVRPLPPSDAHEGPTPAAATTTTTAPTSRKSAPEPKPAAGGGAAQAKPEPGPGLLPDAAAAVAEAAGAEEAGLLPVPLAEAAAAAGARSVAERYGAMRATVGRRLAAGKSAIHGLGAFAKRPHKRGDMMIEYVGDLIRPIVSDLRERRTYDSLVGCGTYIFSLNGEQHIDATRAGNMAHLLNHSCDPNCYSRAITLTDPATGAVTDHVIITAKRDIAAWEELTYDYRFNGAEDLPCNCGAATCRGLVNWPDAGQEEEGDMGGPDAGGAPHEAGGEAAAEVRPAAADA
ncbi:hypothetical protein HYH03_003832 [Edaphochlamys debaryana]|uniref:Histone-lysine N-methyltransferase n=1 Tax=Edaphochlamys debaryana TaxID=47281 RepID=A0A836C3S6_9CHLO|nr:hypothetical protein HYH03_003832 [Edaphochlamys debaryana]|eukprot:KAG2498072.1 hypothetical protein HYH03_003832 [Edaphochlamys debaryana]